MNSPKISQAMLDINRKCIELEDKNDRLTALVKALQRKEDELQARCAEWEALAAEENRKLRHIRHLAEQSERYMPEATLIGFLEYVDTVYGAPVLADWGPDSDFRVLIAKTHLHVEVLTHRPVGEDQYDVLGHELAGQALTEPLPKTPEDHERLKRVWVKFREAGFRVPTQLDNMNYTAFADA